jgi:hypothetical protein
LELPGLKTLLIAGAGLNPDASPGERIPGRGALSEGLPAATGADVVGFFGLVLRPTVDKRDARVAAADCGAMVDRLAVVVDGVMEARFDGDPTTLCLERAAAD